VGLVALALLVGGLGVWSVRTRITGAVIANGMIVVESNRQVVQHAEGGVVGAILARDGARVKTGDLLIRLDGTLLGNERAVTDTQLVEVRARRAMLEAERDGLDAIAFPADLLTAAAVRPETERQIASQRTLLSARRDSLAREAAQIDERIRQTAYQITGTQAQLKALGIEQGLVDQELGSQESLLQKGLVQTERVVALRREAARLAGEIGKLTADIARFRGQIAGFEIDKVKLRTTLREDAVNTLRDLQYREIELTEQRRSLTERLARLEIRAPVGGVVYGSTVFAVSAVVRAAEPLMYIIPQDQPLIVAARVDANDIDRISVGQPATLRFTAFDRRITPVVAGTVSDVSADVFQDEAKRRPYYRVELVPDEADLAKLDNQALLPGMPVEAFLRTADRTPLSYLTKPMTDYFGRAMRGG